MYSLNVPVPPAVERLAAELHPRLVAFDRIRERHTLVLKRFEETSFDRLRERLRPLLADVGPVEARTDGLGVFEAPPAGPSPVVYLAVESPGLVRLHDRLVEAFGAAEGLEGGAYVPHVTLARGGDVADARALADLAVEDVAWTVSELAIWSREYREPAATVPLRG